jgi:Domain of unknown function (DUF4337)
MAELEIHHESEHKADPTGQKVGILAAILAVALAIVTIASHRTHTAAIISKSSANDAWAHYQATRMKYHNLELGQSLVQVFGTKGGPADAMLADTASQMQKYDKQAKGVQAEAERDEREGEAAEDRALRYDVGEGLLEIGLVLSSMYFISRKPMFPVIGVIAGLVGTVIAITGFFA